MKPAVNPSLRFQFVVMLAVLMTAGVAAAQDQFADPPSRVARMQFIEGQVSLQPGGVDDWVAAGLNRPLTTADRIWTDPDSRAEMTTGSAVLRLGSETSLTVTNLTDNTAQFELDQGSLLLSVRTLNEGEVVEVDTPNVAFTVWQPGTYRLEVMPDADQTSIQVRGGDGEASGRDSSMDVPSDGQLYQFGNGQSLEYTVADATPPDRFERWSVGREQMEIVSPSAQYVAPGTIGYEALDGNGYWETSPMYGAVWYPNVHAGWAPYHEGHWAWVSPWGWTWVDDAPWGFAPFHYGRWVNAGGRWGWIPGPVDARPVYAPALVAWIGGGPGFGVSFGLGGGGVGWVALGWHDPFIPSYQVSPGYARNVNISSSRAVNITVINNYYSTTNVEVRNNNIRTIQYENARVNGAITAVPNAAFSSGKPVAQAAVVIPPASVARVSFGAAANVVPTKEAVLGGKAPATAPAKLVAPRQVIAKTPPPPPPVSFAQQRPLLEKSNGVPLSPAATATIRASSPAPAVHGARPAVITAAPTTNKPGAPASRPATAPAPHPAPAPAPGARPSPPAALAPESRPAAPPAAAPHPAPSPAPGARPSAPAAPAPESRPATPPAARPATPPAAAPHPAPAPAPGARPAASPAAAPHPAPAPAPAVHPSAPPAGKEAAPAQKEKNPPPGKDNDKEQKEH